MRWAISALVLTLWLTLFASPVYEEIEQHSQIQHQGPRTRRSRSFSHDNSNSAPPAQNGAGFSLDRSATFDNSEDGFSVGHGQRSSVNKMFKSNSADRSSSPASHTTSKHTRSESIVSAMRRSADVHTPTADSAEDQVRAPHIVRRLFFCAVLTLSPQEFDNLLKSGNVMKLSLTPDRLQTFEVQPGSTPLVTFSSSHHLVLAGGKRESTKKGHRFSHADVAQCSNPRPLVPQQQVFDQA